MFWDSPRKAYERQIYSVNVTKLPNRSAYFGPISQKIASNSRLSAADRRDLLKQLQDYQLRKASSLTGADWKIQAKRAVANSAKQQLWGSNDSHLPQNVQNRLKKLRGWT